MIRSPRLLSASLSVSLSVALLGAATAVRAQSIADVGARTAPQFHSYSIGSPSDEKISEFSFPLYVLVPVTSSLSFDLGTAYARSHVAQTVNGTTTTSDIAGMTDTQIRANYVVGTDFLVLTGGINLPTGEDMVRPAQRSAAELIGSDFLAFPIAAMGTGFGATAGAAIARPLGDWNFGAGLGVRRSAAYDPFADEAGNGLLRYQPGNEYRARVGVDRAVGTGRVTLGLTYSTFGNDDLAGSIYNTGNRWLSQFSFENTYGPGDLAITGWNLYRAAGTLADSSYLPHENIAVASMAYGLSFTSATLEPNVEGRVWTPAGGTTSYLGTIGVRSQMTVAGFAILPSVGYSFGTVGAQDANLQPTTATITGFHAILAIRLR